MAYEIHVELGEGKARRRVAVRELSVAEIRDWLKALTVTDTDEPVDLADYLLYEDEGLRLRDFYRLTDLSFDDIQVMPPSELDAVLAKSKEVNPRFFTVLGRVLAMGRMSIHRAVSTRSSAPAPSLRNWLTRMFTRGHGAG